MKVLLIGLGRWGEKHLRVLNELAEEVWVGGAWLERFERITAPAPGSPLPWILLVLALGVLGRLAWLFLGLVALRTWRRTAAPAELPSALADRRALWCGPLRSSSPSRRACRR